MEFFMYKRDNILMVYTRIRCILYIQMCTCYVAKNGMSWHKRQINGSVTKFLIEMRRKGTNTNCVAYSLFPAVGKQTRCELLTWLMEPSCFPPSLYHSYQNRQCYISHLLYVFTVEKMLIILANLFAICSLSCPPSVNK